MKEKRFGKKQAVLMLMVLVLGAAVYLNYYVAANTPVSSTTPTEQSQGETDSTTALGESQFVNNTTAASEETYFDAARRSREEARQEALDILQETLQDVKADEATEMAAVETVATVAKAVEQEDAIESLIKSKGFEDCVVYIENGSCHVAVKATELTEAQTLQITEIITTQSDVGAGDVHIVAVE